jgi:hypothetical protein
MSEVKTDKLSPRTASGTVTLGTSGDTFTVPSGATLDIASGATFDTTGATVSGLTTGKVLQVVEGNYSTNVTTSSQSYVTTGLTQSITPSSSSSKILVTANVMAYMPSEGFGVYVIYRGASAIGDECYFYTSYGAQSHNLNLMYLDSPSTTSATTYAVYFKAINGGGSPQAQYSGYGSRILLMEIGA